MMDLGQVLAEISTALAAIDDFADANKRHVALVSRITPPCVLIEPRPDINYLQTYDGAAPGMDLFGIDVTALVSLMGPTSTWGTIAPYISRSGPKSVPAAVNQYDYTTCSDVTVASAELVVGTYAGNQYLGVTFSAVAGG